MKPRKTPAGVPAGPDEDAFADFCVLVIEAMQVPEVVAVVADAINTHNRQVGPRPGVPAPQPVRHSPPARGHRH